MMRVSMDKEGRLTLPTELREALGLKPGEALMAEVEGDKLVLRSAAAVALGSLREIGQALKEAGVTEEELQASGREIRKELFRERYPHLADKYGV